VTKAGESTNELLPPEVQFVGWGAIFLIMTAFRIWFDLAEVDVVLSDRRAVRKSIWSGLRHTFKNLFRLLANYVVVTLVAAIVLAGGLWTWMKIVSPQSVLGAFVVSQLTLLLLLIPRFWQRGVAVSYWRQKMMAPVVAMQPTTPVPIAPQSILPQPIVTQPVPPPAVPEAAPVIPKPPEPQGF